MQVRAKMPIALSADVFRMEENTRVYWLGGAAFLICSHGTNILIDPQISFCQKNGNLFAPNGLRLFCKPPLSAEEAVSADIVLYTHADDDHFEAATAQKLGAANILIVGPAPVFEKAVHLGIPEKQLKMIRPGDCLEIGKVKITVFPADHPWQLLNTAKFGRPYGKEDCVGFIVETQDVRMFISGDTRLLPEHTTLENIDILAMDASSCSFHLSVQGSAALCCYLPKAWLLPCHYGTYDAPGDPAHGGDPSEVLSLVENAQDRLIDAAPGEKIVFLDHQYQR